MRSLAPAVQLPEVDLEARLALAEFLLTTSDIQASSRCAIDWLTAHSNVEQALVALTDPFSGHIVLAAGHGVSSATIEEFSVSCDDEAHPLVQAIRQTEPIYFKFKRTARFQLPLDGPFHALPLRSDEDAGSPCGLLLVRSPTPELQPEVLWLGRMLGGQVSRLLLQPASAEPRFGRKRLLLYSIINAVTDPILLTDTEGKLIIVNTHAEKLFAAPDDASEGRRRAVGVNNMRFSAALSASATAHVEPARRELLLVDPLEGSDLTFELLSSQPSDELQGTFVVSILRNVTDLARAKKEIEESYRTLRLAQADVRDERHRLELIIDSVADPIIVTDPDGEIVLMNEPAERMFTFPAGASEAAQGRVEANGAHLTSFVSNVLTRSDESRYRGELHLTDPASGRAAPVEGVAGQILSERGELIWVVTILHDMTEALERARLYDQLKQVSAELERKVQEATAELAEQNELLRRQHIALEQASALKSQFLANMSHEFRTPLNAILGYSQMLLHGVTGAVTDAQRKSLSRIDSNSRHLLALINDILDITRIEAGRMPLNITTFAIPDLVDEVITELEPIIRRSTLTVHRRIRGKLPKLRSDRSKVKQIVLNLLSNALKFTPAGKVTITASVNSREKVIAITVRDTGVGIAPEDQATVFEDFRQLDSSPARGYGGTGLGLSICRRLAQMLGGAIDLNSEVGKGSSFTLSLPVKARRK